MPLNGRKPDSLVTADCDYPAFDPNADGINMANDVVSCNIIGNFITGFSEGLTMTKTSGTATSIIAPRTNGTFKLFVINAQGKIIGESAALPRISGGTFVEQKTVMPEIPGSRLPCRAESSSSDNRANRRFTLSTYTGPTGSEYQISAT